MVLQNGGLLPSLIEDDGKRHDDTRETGGDGIHAIDIKSNQVLDKQAVTATGNPPAQRAGQQGQREPEKVSSHLSHTQGPAGIARNQTDAGLDHQQRHKAGNDIGQEYALDSPLKTDDKNHAEQADEKCRQDTHDDKCSVITQATENLGINIL